LVVTPAWARARLPARGTDTHKNRVGRLLVVAGKSGMAGAAILSARAAFRAGAGLVRVCSPPDNRVAIQTGVPEAIYVDATDSEAIAAALTASDALAAGPGLGTNPAAARILLAALAGSPLPTVLDADALNLAATGRSEAAESAEEHDAGHVDLASLGRARPLLITPHPGEMARLQPERAAVPEDRVGSARSAAERFSCAVLLKGAPSLVVDRGGPVRIDSQGSSDLAVAGMGDVLTGVCGALMAQGVSPGTAGAVALYLSGRAARLAGRGAALTPSDVVRWLPDALGEGGRAWSNLELPFVTYDADPAR
jgi:hydroxyethylthiazole kinase-like uncharacterized protein yjeF